VERAHGRRPRALTVTYRQILQKNGVLKNIEDVRKVAASRVRVQLTTGERAIVGPLVLNAAALFANLTRGVVRTKFFGDYGAPG